MNEKRVHLLKFLTVASLFSGALIAPLPLSATGLSNSSTSFATSQQAKSSVKGQVLDEKGEPVIGASVVVKGTKIGASTDFDGNFTFDAPVGSTIVVSYIGYKPKETKFTGDDLVIKLDDDSQVLNEVVVTALGIKKEAKSLSYNVQQLKGSDVMQVQDANFVNSLSGKVAGVTINSSSTGVGGGSRVVMRGAKSINGNNNVLYVIDGVPMPNLSNAQPEGIFDGAGQSGDAVSNINPDDIESLSVLSGPSAAALYGSAAANGVILITTKKGKVGRASVTIANNTQFSKPFVMPQFQNVFGPSEAGSYFSWGQKLATPSSYDPRDFFQTGVNVTNSASLSVGSEKNQTYLSVGTTNAQGIIHNNNYDRYNVSFRNTTKFLNDKLTLDLSYMLTTVKEQNMISQGQYHNPLVPVYLFPAGDDWSKVTYFERYDADRNFPVQYWPYNFDMSMENPYWETEREKFINHKERNMATVSLKWDALDWLSFTGRVKYDNTQAKSETKLFASTNTLFASKTGHYALYHDNNRQLYAEAFATINKYFDNNRWNITSNIGTSFDQRDNSFDGFNGHLKGTPNKFTLANVQTSDAGTKYAQSGYTTRLEALYASAQLGYRSMAYLDVTARNDWSSKLEDHYFYYSAGISGIFTDIFPQIKNDYLNYFKARFSYSEVGNEPNSPFLTRPSYGFGANYPMTTTRMLTDLKPERTKSFELGIDLVLIKNRLKVNTTLYQSRTYNQFFYPELPASSGYTSAVVNGGRVDNKGIELSARYNQKFGDLNWETYMTWTVNRNKVKELLHDWTNPIDGKVYNLTTLNMGSTSGYKIMLTEGGTMGDIYVSTLKTDEHGAIYIDPRTQTVEAQANKFVKAGKATPNYNLSWGNNLSWKGLNLGFLFTYRNGGIVVSETQAILDYYGASKASADARLNNGVVVNGKTIPAQEYYQTVGSPNGTIDSRYVYSATNLRLAELSLGYDVPVNKYVKWIKGLNVAFVAHNLCMLYNKAPFDPETTANTGTYFQGIDYFMQPSLRNMGFSVKVNF